ncbi:MAG: 50S ribosomal protein L29 [Methylococcus sp.]
MDLKEIRSKTISELREMLVTQHRERFNLRMQKATGQLSKPDLIKKNRVTIARINTIISEKEGSA